MSPQAQRIAIAEACGWEDCKRATQISRVIGKTVVGTTPRLRAQGEERAKRGMPNWPYIEIPDYLTDLNAMHEAEKGLTRDARIKYKGLLNQITQGEHDNLYEHHNDVFATASQRAEAFLRSIGKWVEPPTPETPQ